MFRNSTRMSAEGIPTIALVFGNSTAGGAYVPGMCDYIVMVSGAGQGLPGRAAAGEDGDRRRGGRRGAGRRGDAHARLWPVRLPGRRRARRAPYRPCRSWSDLHWRKLSPGPAGPGAEPKYDPEELLGIADDLRLPVRDPRGDRAPGGRLASFDEFKPLYGATLVTGYAHLHGFPVGILGNNGVLFSEESEKAAQFIQLANRATRR